MRFMRVRRVLTACARKHATTIALCVIACDHREPSVPPSAGTVDIKSLDGCYDLVFPLRAQQPVLPDSDYYINVPQRLRICVATTDTGYQIYAGSAPGFLPLDEGRPYKPWFRRVGRDSAVIFFQHGVDDPVKLWVTLGRDTMAGILGHGYGWRTDNILDHVTLRAVPCEAPRRSQ
jgi:hypothetical protein